jgi:hypothetical protein
MRARTNVSLLTFWLVARSIVCAAGTQPEDGPPQRALRFFQALEATDVAAWLRASRPAPATPADRARAVGVLPEKGDLTPDSGERAKLAALQRILAYHERGQVFEIRLIDVPQAVIALYDRAVILISRPALRLVSGPELQALVAHEIGHEYFWSEFERSRERDDKPGRQELELKCDGIAVLTLAALNLDPARLMAGLRKIWGFNQALGATANAGGYPTMRDRERLVAAVQAMTSARAVVVK